MSHAMLESKRATRGKRMNSLVGEAAEEDNEFWGHEVWQEGEGSDEESFRTVDEEDKPDEFDSDFNESESEDDEEEDLEEERAAQKGGKDQSKVNRYKDPALLKSKSKGGLKNPFASANEGSNEVMDVDNMEEDNENETASQQELRQQQQKPLVKERKRVTYEITPRTVRDSTKSKTKTADKERAKRHEEEKKKRKTQSAKPTTAHFKFKDLLEEALQTEDENRKWLKTRKFWLQHKEEQERKVVNSGENTAKDYIRYYSRRNVGTYVSFSSSEAVPICLRAESNRPPTPPPDNICVITGQIAKYRDPKTMLPYANAAAFRELRRRHAAGKLKSKSSTPGIHIPTRKDTSAQKVVRVAVHSHSMDIVDDEELQSPPYVDVEAAGSMMDRPLSLSRTLSHSSLPRSANQSQSTTPRHSGLAMSTPHAASAANSRGLSSPMSPGAAAAAAAVASPSRPPIYQIQPSRIENDMSYLSDPLIVPGRPHIEGNNIVYISPTTPLATHTTDSSISDLQSIALPPGIKVMSTSDKYKWVLEEDMLALLTADPELLLKIPTDKSTAEK